ncbi:putative proline rich signal peptide protein [Candidatus Burkholderia brachyanthoides]|nr:putative proline rich signal peptide protein [Candidatus Burkholderia brachyanthoides]
MTIKRFFPLRLAVAVWAALAFWLSFALAGAAHAETISVQRASLQADNTGWSLDAHFDFDLNSSLEEAVNHSVPLYFSLDFTLSRPRWYWFDEEPVNVSQSLRLSYQPLTNEYRVSTGGLQLRFASLNEVMAVIKHITSWHVIDRNQVHPGETYDASVRLQLDIALMPKPFQIDAVNNRDWNLSSDWKKFTFTAFERAK